MSASDDLKRVSQETANRLDAVGVWLNGRESTDELTNMQEAVERFEAAVQAHGGDLMMDEGVPGQVSQPDDPHFGLPRRAAGEAVSAYLERVARVTDTVRQHRKLGGA